MMKNIAALLGFLVLLASISCKPEIASKVPKDIIDYASLKLPSNPNILWIVAEDLSAYIPSYGDSTVATPNISRLEREGVKYTHFYSPSGVCAPSRAAIATGMYPTRIGAHHMRTGPWFRFNTSNKAIANYGRQAYEAMPPDGVHMLSTYLRKAGYYCSNNPKEDYQFRSEIGAWDESSFNAHWNKREENQPFYAVFNIDVTHESMIWRKSNDSLFVDEDLEVPIPPYLPATKVAIKDIRRNYSNIVEMDKRVGEILNEIEEAGELENTIIFWYTDHGGPLPRQKRTVYDSGIHVPMIIRFPNQQFAGKVDDQLLSFIDLKPTVLSLTNIEPPIYLDGKAWLGPYAKSKERQYLFASADRFDNETDKVRAVFNKKYKLIKYYNLDQPYYLPVKYRETMPIMKELLRLRDKDSLTEVQAQWFRKTKDSIEFFDLENDPYEIRNLANDPQYEAKINEMHAVLNQWIIETNDKGQLSEEAYVASIWQDGRQPITTAPIISLLDDEITITTSTKGATVGYQWVNNEDELSNNWQVYTKPLHKKTDKKLFIQAHRIGFKPSNIKVFHIE